MIADKYSISYCIAQTSINCVGVPHEMDALVDVDKCVRSEEEKLTPMQQENVTKLKQSAIIKKNQLNHTLDGLSTQLKKFIAEKESVKNNRLKLLMTEHKISLLNYDISKKKEGLFFDEMRIAVETKKR